MYRERQRVEVRDAEELKRVVRYVGGVQLVVVDGGPKHRHDSPRDEQPVALVLLARVIAQYRTVLYLSRQEDGKRGEEDYVGDEVERVVDIGDREGHGGEDVLQLAETDGYHDAP